MPFTPDQRVSDSDPVLRVRHHITSNISLADDGEYSLGPKVPTGFAAANPRAQVSLDGRYRVKVTTLTNSDADPQGEFSVRKRAQVVPTAWAVSANVATLTVPAGHGLQVGQWIVVGGFATAPAAVGNVTTKALVQITGQTSGALAATTITYAAVTGNASATENGTIDSQKVSLMPGPGEVLYDNITQDESEITIGVARRGRYRLSDEAQPKQEAWFVYDGTTLDIQSTTIATDEPEVSFDDADTAAKTNLFLSGSNLVLSNNDAIASRIRLEFYPADQFSGLDVDNRVCLFEKRGDLVLRNRLGSTQTFEIERL